VSRSDETIQPSQLERRRNALAARELWLRVVNRPVTGSRRRFTRRLLTIAVSADGLLISTLTRPGQ